MTDFAFVLVLSSKPANTALTSASPLAANKSAAGFYRKKLPEIRGGLGENGFAVQLVAVGKPTTTRSTATDGEIIVFTYTS